MRRATRCRAAPASARRRPTTVAPRASAEDRGASPPRARRSTAGSWVLLAPPGASLRRQRARLDAVLTEVGVAVEPGDAAVLAEAVHQAPGAGGRRGERAHVVVPGIVGGLVRRLHGRGLEP